MNIRKALHRQSLIKLKCIAIEFKIFITAKFIMKYLKIGFHL